MAGQRNVTIAIDADLVEQALVIAIRRGCSISALLADRLRELVGEDRTYEAARQSAKAMLRHGYHLQGARKNDRSNAHIRRPPR